MKVYYPRLAEFLKIVLKIFILLDLECLKSSFIFFKEFKCVWNF